VELIAVLILLGILSTGSMSGMVKPSAFAPQILSHELISQARLARRLATARQDAVITLTVDAALDEWRFQIDTNLEGNFRSTRISSKHSSLQANSGGINAAISAASALIITFDALGDLSAVSIGGSAGDPATGISLTIGGDSTRTACIYPSGYAAQVACG
jgi:type II secretory pathway pseudopilin PulG